MHAYHAPETLPLRPPPHTLAFGNSKRKNHVGPVFEKICERQIVLLSEYSKYCSLSIVVSVKGCIGCSGTAEECGMRDGGQRNPSRGQRVRQSG